MEPGSVIQFFTVALLPQNIKLCFILRDENGMPRRSILKDHSTRATVKDRFIKFCTTDVRGYFLFRVLRAPAFVRCPFMYSRSNKMTANCLRDLVNLYILAICDILEKILALGSILS